MTYRTRLVLLILLLISLMGSSGPAAYAQDRYLTDKGGGRHVWYVPLNTPNGYYAEAQHKTYITFHGGGPDEDYLDPMVMSYDHETGAIDGPAKAGENVLAAKEDFHGNPALIVDDAGYIHVIYGGHGHEDQMKHAVSKRPGDLSAWEHLDNIETATSYPCLVKLDGGRIFYFYRDGGHHDNWSYVISEDNGRTFSAEHVLTKGDVTRNDSMYYEGEYWDGWYGLFRKGPDGAIHHITKYHAGAPDWGDAYHGQRRTNLYYVRFVPGEGWKNLQGRLFDLPLTLPTMDEHFRFFDAPVKKGLNQVLNVEVNDVAFDEEGRVYVGYRFGHGRFTSTWRITRLAILQPGTGYTTKVFPFGSDYDTMGKWGWAMNVSRPGHLTVYGDRLRVSDDFGDTWQDEGAWADVPMEDPSRVSQAHPEALLMAASPRGEAPYRQRNVYLWGEEGFITPDVEFDWTVERRSANQTRMTLTARNRTDEPQQGTVQLSARSATSGVRLAEDPQQLLIRLEPGQTVERTVTVTHPPQHERIYLRARPDPGPWTWAERTLGPQPAA